MTVYRRVLVLATLGWSFGCAPQENPRGESGETPESSAVEDARDTLTTTDVEDATKSKPFINDLGMRFVPVPIGAGPSKDKRVLFSVWETRVQDYAAYAAENAAVDMSWKGVEHEGHGQAPDHPVVNVSWEDAVAFCRWLTEKERKAGGLGAGDSYRLPTDVEWSYAVGIGDREDAGASPKARDEEMLAVYPWDNRWPPPSGAGNFYSGNIDSYSDDHRFTAPVGSYDPNSYGLHDLSGNVWEHCSDWWDPERRTMRVLRGGSWDDSTEVSLRSSSRLYCTPAFRLDGLGFRVVVEAAGG